MPVASTGRTPSTHASGPLVGTHRAVHLREAEGPRTGWSGTPALGSGRLIRGEPTTVNALVPDFAASVCPLRHDRTEQGPTEPHAGRGTFLPSSGGACGGSY